MDKHEALYKDVSSLEVVAYTTRDGDFEDGVTFILEKLDAIPVADVQIVRHGKWINEPPYKAMDGTYKKGQECSNCHAYFVSDGNTPYSNHPYCCECGAKMDGGT